RIVQRLAGTIDLPVDAVGGADAVGVRSIACTDHDTPFARGDDLRGIVEAAGLHDQGLGEEGPDGRSGNARNRLVERFDAGARVDLDDVAFGIGRGPAR